MLLIISRPSYAGCACESGGYNLGSSTWCPAIQ